MTVKILDIRKRYTAPVFWTKARLGQARAYRRLRPLTDIDAFGLHHLGPHASADPKPGETVEDRAVWRARRQPYHIWVQPDLVVLAWPFECVTWHGNALNHRSIGIVVAGNFPSLEAHRAEQHDAPAPYAAALAAAFEAARLELPQVRLLLTHSQVANKPADPGEAIARIATNAGAAMTPPITCVPGYSAGTGRPWPDEWRKPLFRSLGELEVDL